MTLDGPEGWERWAWTLTIRREVDPEEWRSIWKDFRGRLRYAGIPVIWRVELQRRGVPHIHCVAWLHDDLNGGRPQRIFREGWLEATGETDDTAAWNHAVHGGPIASDREFSAYVAAHTSKGKASQLGWKGRQWGVIGRDLLTEVKPVEIRFTVPGQEIWFARFLERHLRTVYRGKNKRRVKVSRTNGQCRFLGPETVRRLMVCAYQVAKSRPREEPMTIENLSTGKVSVMK